MESVVQLGKKLATQGPVKFELSPRRVRILHNKEYILDTMEAKYVWEHPYYPQYYVNHDQLRDALLDLTHKFDEGFAIGTLHVGDRNIENCLKLTNGPLQNLVRVPFAAPDAWFEEDQQIYVHPKDPYKRVDILPSTRHITVKINNFTIAESSNCLFLFETGLPTRYYLPVTSVHWRFLTPSDTTTRCPYKGEANYYNVDTTEGVHRDLVWYYRYPTPESITIAGRVCFYNEKVDIYIDGELQPRPKTPFG